MLFQLLEVGILCVFQQAATMKSVLHSQDNGETEFEGTTRKKAKKNEWVGMQWNAR